MDFEIDNEQEISDAQFENIDESESLGKRYILEEKNKLLNWIKKGLKNGCNVYSNIDDIEELIDIIVNWYKCKYPNNIIEMSESSCGDKLGRLFPQEDRFRKLDKLSSNMGYTELMFRIPKHLHPIIECWYKGNETDNVSAEIKFYTKYTLNVVTKKISIDKYDGCILDNRFLLNNECDNLLNFDCSTIEEFINKNENNQNFSLEELDRMVATHEYDLETRNKIFNLIVLKLFYSDKIYSDKDIRYGYIRAKMFIEEFNKYIYNLNLNENNTFLNDVYGMEWVFNSIIPIQWEKDEANYILKDLKPSKSDSIDECGLSFKTLCLLKDRGIHEIHNPSLEEVYDYLTDNSIYNFHIPTRDKKIIEELIFQQKLLKKMNEEETRVEDFDADKLLDDIVAKHLENEEDKVMKKGLKKSFFKRKNK